MARIDEGARDISNDDAPGFLDIQIEDFPEDIVREYLGRDPEAEFDTRSQTVAVRLPNGDLILGFYPQGDTYMESVDFYLTI